MVGGGLDAFIGAVHRRGAALDGEIELVCGAFSSSPEKSKAAGEALYLPENRVYSSYDEMFAHEKTLPEGKRMDFVSIVTPNHLHFDIAMKALQNGFHVVSDKPATFNTDQARELKKTVEASGLIYALTYNYTAYPMMKEARWLVAQGEIGEIRKVIVEYPQGWLFDLLEATGQKQAAWRTDPAQSGNIGGVGDIGTHAESLIAYITGLEISELLADLTVFVEGRKVDDDANMLLRFSNGAKGVLHNSQICHGEENDLNIRIYGTKGGLKWRQMEPNTLIRTDQALGHTYIRTGVNARSPHAAAHTRQPSGHPEGYIETFGSIYRNFAKALRIRIEGDTTANAATGGLGGAYASGVFDGDLFDFPTINDGLRGMLFIDTVVKSHKNGSVWTKTCQ